jgi:dTDP-4-dehydrorhamnose reductase
MKILIIGAGSLTGGSLIPMLLEETDATIFSVSSKVVLDVIGKGAEEGRVIHKTLDILDKQALRDYGVSVMPDVIVNLAAMTNVDLCESDKQLAWQLNVTLVENLVRIARITDAHLVHLSTDYVFDGTKGPYTETDTPKPLNYYGKTKLAGETAVITSGVTYTIIRTIVVYGYNQGRPDFVRWVLDAFDAETPIRVANDQIANATYVDDLSEAIMFFVLERRVGLYHVGGSDHISRYDFALKIAETFKSDPSLITPVPTSELKQVATRPLKAEAALRMKFSGVQSGLLSYRHQLFEQHMNGPTRSK